MEIKTIVVPRGIGTNVFDKQVNDALKEGFQLLRRDVLPGTKVGLNDYTPAYYAELVKPDEPQVPKSRNVLDVLNVVRDFCDSNKCGDCLLDEFCNRYMADDIGPADWVLPER